MYKIDIQEIIDYSKCPMFYFFKYKHNITTDKIDINEKYENDLLKIIYYSFCKIQDEDFIRIEDIKQMWGKLWIKDKRKSDLIFCDSFMNKDLYNLKRIKGLESLLAFRDYLANNNGYPIAINHEYSIKIDDLIITGKFDIVREITNDKGEKEIQTCIFKTDHNVSKLTQKYDMKFICDSIAIKNMVDDNINLSHMVYCIEKNKSIIKQNKALNKELFLHNVKTITNLIKQNIFYMSVNENCNSCTYRDICSNGRNTRLLLDKGDEE